MVATEMNDTKCKPAGNDALPLDRIEQIGDYFKSLFMRSLRLGLDDAARAQPWNPVSPAGPAQPEAEPDTGPDGGSDDETV